MYTNKCIKCGKEFETKNPKRVICPDCLYPDKAQTPTGADNRPANGTETLRSYSFGNDNPQPMQQRYNKRPYNNQGGQYQRNDNRRNYQGTGFQRNNDGQRRSFNNNRPHQGGFNKSGV